jgi:hypothetical protein
MAQEMKPEIRAGPKISRLPAALAFMPHESSGRDTPVARMIKPMREVAVRDTAIINSTPMEWGVAGGFLPGCCGAQGPGL